jgi:3-oxoacyl-[acyl-carrier protein] reductase
VVANTIVTGGSRGLGLQIVSMLAAEGQSIVVIARKMTPELETLIKKPGNQVGFEPFDLAETEKIEGLVKSIRKKYGNISALVNNAATGLDGVLTTLKSTAIEDTIRTNLTAPILLTKAVAKSMLADGKGGRIVNVSSINAFTGYNGLAVYAATKAGLIGFTKSLARELGRAGILVNAVAPGLLETEMVAGMTDDRRDTIRRRSPLNRFASKTETAHAVLFLLSEKSSGITGTTITVDAGNSA